jgi:hypothetical protein
VCLLVAATRLVVGLAAVDNDGVVDAGAVYAYTWSPPSSSSTKNHLQTTYIVVGVVGFVVLVAGYLAYTRSGLAGVRFTRM